ncbi:MAG: hypothetical protein FJ304_24700 [Planctomycetes bacterium]|nr:hypothetical protein [Planctomycetota bacterium]
MPELTTSADRPVADWLASLAGTWSVFVNSRLIGPCTDAPKVPIESWVDYGAVGSARYEEHGEGSTTAEYGLTTALFDCDESARRWTCRLQFGPTQKDVVFLGDDTRSPEILGERSDAELRFASDYHEGCVFWRPFAHLGEGDSLRPDKFSIIIRNVSPSCWLLDACFYFRDEDSADTIPPTLFRTEWWHCRLGTKPVVDDAEQQLDAAKSERERARAAIDEQKARLEEALAVLDDKARTLEALEAEEEHLRNALEWSELGDTLQERHRELLRVAPGVHGPLESGDPIGRELAALVDLEQDASLLESGMGSLADSVEEVADDVAAALWIDTHYARGQRLLTRFGDGIPPADMTLLDSAEPNVGNMKVDSQTLLASALRQYALATTTDAYRDHDYSPVIAAFAKCCERAFADAFDVRVTTVLADPVVAELLTKPNEWEYSGPPEAVELQKCDYCNRLVAQ